MYQPGKVIENPGKTLGCRTLCLVFLGPHIICPQLLTQGLPKFNIPIDFKIFQPPHQVHRLKENIFMFFFFLQRFVILKNIQIFYFLNAVHALDFFCCKQPSLHRRHKNVVFVNKISLEHRVCCR